MAPNKPDTAFALFSAHEDRLRTLEAGMRQLESLTATSSANLVALSRRVDDGNDNVLNRLDSMKESLTDKVADIAADVKSLHSKSSKEKERWSSLWLKIFAYFMTTGIAGTASLIVHEFVIKPHMNK